MKKSPIACPCGSKKSYAVCCKLAHQGRPTGTAEVLMRSRYSAYVLELTDYLLATWHPRTRPAALSLSDNRNWKGLKVIATESTGMDTATVEFVARYHNGENLQRLNEISRFERVNSCWFYLDGQNL